ALDPGGSHGIDAVLRDNGRGFARHRHADVALRQRVAGHAVRPAGRAKDCDAARGNTIVLYLAALDRSKRDAGTLPTVGGINDVALDNPGRDRGGDNSASAAIDKIASDPDVA